ERSEITRHTDNLTVQGEFEGKPTSKDDYKPVKGERADIKKYKDNLTLEGEWDIKRSRDDYTAVHSEKVTVGEGEDPTQWKKMYTLTKKKEGEEEEEEEEYDSSDYPQRAGRQKQVLDIAYVFK
ncbi:hypothetical protein GN156_22625, partial [bacterium LRH843]|nr:hypothetical protein [bacterium LRH843]